MSSNNTTSNHTLPSAASVSSPSSLSSSAPAATETIPITTSAFASALTTLPLSSLHAKVAELRNSLVHLHSSNAYLQAALNSYARGHNNNSNYHNDVNNNSRSSGSDGSDDAVLYADAITENRELMGRLRVRIALLRREIVEVRGMEWVYGDEDRDGSEGDGHGPGHGQSEEVIVATNGSGGSEAGVSLVKGERTSLGARGDGPAITSSEAGVMVAGHGMVGEHESHENSLGQNGEQPNRRLIHEELQQRPRERLSDRQGSETEGVYL